MIINSLVVGLLTVAIGYIVGYVLGNIMKVDLPAKCAEWNQNHIMELSLFLTGFIVSIIMKMYESKK